MVSIHGHEITVLNHGISDHAIGVDIKRHAKIEINGKLEIGDVVFTETIREYYEMKFHLNSRLNRCILHVAARDEFTNLRVRLQNMKPITTVIGSVIDW